MVNDPQTDALLQQVQAGIQKMKQRNQRLEKENEALRQTVMDYLQQLEEQKKETEALRQNQQHALMGELLAGDRKNILREIDRYILLLDKCIATVKSSL